MRSKLFLHIKFISLTTALAIAFCSCFPVFAAPQGITLNYDGKAHMYTAPPIHLLINGTRVIDLEVPPIIIEDYTLVPVRAVMEFMGAEVGWNPDTQQITLIYDDTTVVLKINDTTAYINGKAVEMPVPPKNINGRTMIPLRFVADNLNFLVYWDNLSRTVYIDSTYESTDDNNILPDGLGYYIPVEPSSEHYNIGSDSSPAINRNLSLSLSENIIPATDKSTSEIESLDYPETTVISIIEPEGADNAFTIKTSSAISKVEKRLLSDNRMYLDIYGAELELSETVFTYADNPNVRSVRAAQNQIEPEKVVRVVFDLKDGAEYSVEISKDRKSLTVNFPGNRISSVLYSKAAGKDAVIITGEQTPGISIWPASDTRLVIDIPFAEIDNTSFTCDGEFVNEIITQRHGDTARIVLDLSKRAGYSASVSDNTATVSLFSPTQKHIEYDYANKRIAIEKSPGLNLNINNFIHKDNYNTFEYIITIPMDLSEYLGHGEVYIGDDRINTFNISTTDGQTSITINETGIFAYLVYEDDSKIYIRPVSPKEKYDKIVILDAGHGGEVSGASALGFTEADLNLDILLRLHELLERDGRVKVYATRLTNVNPSLSDRVQFATEYGDLFISIHNNGAPNREAKGTETFYCPRPFDEYLGISGYVVAEILQNRMVSVLGSVDRGVKTENFQVISTSQVPAALVEVGFMSNSEEAALLAASDYRTMAALSLYAGIIDIFEIYMPPR